MAEEEYFEPFAVDEVFVDGFAKHVLSRNGFMSCIGYRELDGRKIAVIRLAWPAVTTDAAIQEAQQAMGAPPGKPPSLRIVT